MKLKHKLTKTLLSLGAAAALIITVPVAVVSCSSSSSFSSSSPSVNVESNLLNNNYENDTTSVFATNAHNNVNFANLAAIVNYNEISNIYSILNDPEMAPFMQWLSTQSIVVVSGQIPNPSWTRIPTTAEEQAIEQDMVVCTPQLYPMLYASPQNKEYPGLGMQMALPSSTNNLNTFLSNYKGEIIAHEKGQPDTALYNSMIGSADIVLYVYPKTSAWVTTSLAQEALKPLLTTKSQAYYQDAIIPVSLAQGFDSLNSPIGIMYLLQSLINGKAYSQSATGTWTPSEQNNWPVSFSSLYSAEMSSLPASEKSNSTDLAYLDSIKPYFDLTQTFGYNLATYGYCSSGATAVFPFAEEYIKTLTSGPKKLATLSCYFNDTSMLIALGFVPTYSTYIIDPGQSSVSDLKNGVVCPTYIQEMYPNLINTSGKLSNAKDGQTTPIKQNVTGIWQHHVDPQIAGLTSLSVGTIFCDDWLMAKTAVIYSNGSPTATNNIVYNTQGDFTLNGESFFTSNNKAANFNTQIASTTNTNEGFFPQNLLNAEYNGQTVYKMLIGMGTTGNNNQYGNAIMNNFRGFQWFSNQIKNIQMQQFQIPLQPYTYSYSGTDALSFKGLSSAELSFYSWNIDASLI